MKRNKKLCAVDVISGWAITQRVVV